MDSGSYRIHMRFDAVKEYDAVFSGKRLCCVLSGIGDDRFGICSALNMLLCRNDIFEIIVAVESENMDVGSLSRAYSGVSIIEFFKKASSPEIITIAMPLMLSSHFLFLESSFAILGLSFKVALEVFASYKDPVAIAPVFVMDDESLFFSVRMPDVRHMSIICELMYPFFRLQDTFYPLSFIAIYDKGRLAKIGGFDLRIRDEHCQLVEFAARCWLSGFSVLSWKGFALQCSDPERLLERMFVGKYQDAVNFRALFLYKRPSDKFNVRMLHFLFRTVDPGFSKLLSANRAFPITFKTLLRRWRVARVEEVSV